MQPSPQEPHRKSDKQGKDKASRLRKRKFERGFQEVPLYPIGYQDGKSRFPQKKDQQGYKPPRLVPWRNNLTACSQQHNLYFVACLDWVYVYQPQYPLHTLPEQPYLKWLLPVTRPFLPGYIPPTSLQEYSPHSVNNMLVAELGNKEILICACDDGDVLAYHTDVLLEKGREHEAGPPIDSTVGSRPKAFFHQNVGKSAWGLAVHKEARLIAVSANTHNIKVFALGLDQTWESSDTVGDGNGEHSTRTSKQNIPKKGSLLQQRGSNHLRVLRRHSANIPCISFCNTPEDPEGRYLASTDISGVTIIWDVDTGKSVRQLAPLRQGNEDDGRFQEDYDSSRDGWGVMFLDARCFARTTNIIQAMGTCFRVRHDLNSVDPRHSLSMYDLSESQIMVRNSAPWTAMRRPPDQEEMITDNFSGGGRYGEGSDDEGDETDQSAATPEPSVFSSHDRLPTTVEQSSFHKNKHGLIPVDQLGPGISQRDLMSHKWSIFSHFTVSPSPETLQSHLPQTPLLLLNPRKLHLFQSADLNLRERNDPSGAPYPVVHLDDPLAQIVPPLLTPRLAQLDRLNLQVPLPELGLVLVGSPKGRVAILSLHRLEPSHDPITGGLQTDVEAPMYTLRLDHLLPLHSQEESGLRPLQPLVGVAASPVFGVESRRPRYRVFLSYLNHAVLVYEVGREGGACGGFSDVFAF